MANTHRTPGRLTLNLAALASNYHLCRSMTSAHVAAAVKANAYGIGMEHAARALITEGCDTFFVASLDEALSLRALDPAITIAVLGGPQIGAENDFTAHHIIPCLSSPDMIDRWQSYARTQDKKLPVILHVDTGINRLGLSADEAQQIIDNHERVSGLDIKIIMSHFACADEKDHPLNTLQADRFAALAAHFPAAEKSLCNSSGLFRNKDWHHDVVRIGYALYGGNPTPETNNPMQSVVTLEVPVLQIRAVKKGESIGYGASHVFDHDTTTATIGVGYADGFLRSASNSARVYWNGQACPVIGRVSMDLVTIDLGGVNGPPPVPGDFIEIIGPHQGVDDLATAAGTIGYEILTSLGTRYARLYRE